MKIGDMVRCRTVDDKPVGLIVRTLVRVGLPTCWVLLGGREVIFLEEALEVISESG
jgi:hypothetical protein